MKNILYLASSSASRQHLLRLATIPFQIIDQTADESIISIDQPLQDLVTKLAVLKMKHVIMPVGKQGDIAFVLTADTMTLDHAGGMHGKPKDRQAAQHMLDGCRAGSRVGSGFCLQKKIFEDGAWVTREEIVGYGSALCVFDVPKSFLDFYLDKVPFTKVSGGVTIEGFGEQFVREVSGSYSSIIGLPMYEIREALFKLGFYAL